MMRLLPALTLAAAALAQDVSVTLATKDGRAKFRMGEIIEVELRFQASVPGQYRVNTRFPSRDERIPKFDRFLVEPAENTSDPLRDIPAQMAVFEEGFGPLPLGMATVTLPLNAWVRFQQPGHYRITAETTRVVGVPLRSNTIEIEITPREPAWDQEQLQQAVAVLERTPPEAPEGRAAYNQDVTRAGRVIRYLDTREAALALARFAEISQFGGAELHVGLYSSPYRKEIIAAMEDAIAAPDVSITRHHLIAVAELAMISRFGPTPDLPADPEARQRRLMEPGPRWGEAVWQEYLARLAAACKNKRGEALAVSLETLASGPGAVTASVATALFENFHLLPKEHQRSVLENEWYRLGSPSAEPALLPLAEGDGPLADLALARLQELNPQAAREIILDRIRRGDVRQTEGLDPRSLLTLPDATLPEMDTPLIEALEAGKPVELLIARYATAEAYPRVRAWVEANPAKFCETALLAYLFRVDPAYAAGRLAWARRADPEACPLGLEPYADLIMSPGLERQAVDDLASPSQQIRREAAALLRTGGTARAEQAVREAVRMHRDDDLLLDALVNAAGWVLSPEEAGSLPAGCVSDYCRDSLRSFQRLMEQPVKIETGSMLQIYGEVGPYSPRTREQFAKKIAQFPKGTRFAFGSGYKTSWFRRQRVEEMRQVLEASGGLAVQDPGQKN